MFSTELSYTLEAAYREAAARKHAYFCVEHILFALLHDDGVTEVISNCGGDIAEMKRDLEEFFDKYVEQIISTTSIADTTDQQIEPLQTPAVQRVLQRAILQMNSAGKDVVTGKEVLVQLLNEEDSHAAYVLARQEISRIDIVNYLSHGISKTGNFFNAQPDHHTDIGSDDGHDDQPPGDKKQKKILKQFAEDLTEQARKGTLDPIIGRGMEIERIVKILSRRQKNNPLLLGDPGVGKTAMASAIAQRIVAGEVPEKLKTAQLFSLHVGTLVAGTKFRGEFEERIRKIVQELSELDNAILFIDEIHTIVGAGATGSGSMDAANLLKPFLASGKLRCIGSTTHEDYKKSFEKDRALSRRFTTIDLDEPTVEETIKILEGLRDKYEKHHNVKYSKNALRAAAELSAKHINERFLPDKAIDVIDEAGAANNLLAPSKRRELLSEKDIEKVVSTIAKVPVKSVSNSDEDVLRNLGAELKKVVFGQDPAVDAISLAIKRSRASLKSEGKPVGAFLFAGPTGVGKTELAKALAKTLGISFHRFDMSEYMEKHAVSRLIGAPPGYVGYEEGGILTDLVRKQPHAVLLFDEIEKAHEDIYSILLQVMDDAMLTDSHGKKADFRNIILIMTTNAGSEKSGGLGFGQVKSDSNRESAIKRLFKPEFRNRLDEVVYFHSLSAEIVARVADKFVLELESQLSERHVKFDLSEAARAWLVEKGYDDALGARPMRRLIQKEIQNPLADEILFGKLKKGGKVSIDVKDGALVFGY